ncbi:RFX-like DNA-binding protein [Pleurotus pulmonarius]
MAAVNMQVMSSNIPLDFLPGGLTRMQALPTEDLYRSSYHLGAPHHNSAIHSDHSPPNHNLTNPALKGLQRHSRTRVAASPYPRDTDSVHSSSSETEDISMYLGANPGSDYHNNMYMGAHTMAPSQEAMNAAGAFGRMSISSDAALEKLAANVRAATTTSASDRAKQIFVQAWLTANYAPYPDGNVPRQGLYFSYRRICDQYSIPHINTATLGKAIRLCFPTIKTRRLGVRGNSKYHYCGIRPATAAEAEWLQDYIQKSNNNAGQASISAARAAQDQGETANKSEDDEDEDSEDVKPVFPNDLSDKTPTAGTILSQQATQRPPSSYPPQASIRRLPGQDGGLSVQGPPASGHPVPYLSSSQHLSVRQLPTFPSIDEAIGSNSTSHHSMAAREVWNWFQDHLDALLDSIRTYRCDQFEMHIRTFWSSLEGSHREVVHAPAIAGLMAKADAIVYDEILEFLRSQMLSSISSASMQSLRQLANKMEKILLAALQNYGNTFVEPKIELGARFGHLVLRYLDIYQVIQALTTVLTTQKQLTEMRRSWTKIDFESVRNQSALVCNCRHEDLVQLLEVEFVSLLDLLSKSPEPVKEVMLWADKCCDRLMGGNRGSPEERGTMSSRSVLIRWGYVTSQIMRDLTIRSDPAFGAFQIFKLFLDDWIAVSVLRSVALSTNVVAASVEPVMQQQYFSMSPMAGQESFGAMDVRPSIMTPTTSSMLAALQSDSFPGSLDATGSGFDSGYGSLSSYMDPVAPQDDSIPSVHQQGLSFPDFSGGQTSFDVTTFTPQDLGIGTTHSTPASEPAQLEPEPGKTDQHPQTAA